MNSANVTRCVYCTVRTVVYLNPQRVNVSSTWSPTHYFTQLQSALHCPEEVQVDAGAASAAAAVQTAAARLHAALPHCHYAGPPHDPLARYHGLRHSVDTAIRSHTCNSEDETLPGLRCKSFNKMRMKMLARLDTAKHRAGTRGLEMRGQPSDSPRDWIACACNVGSLMYGRMCFTEPGMPEVLYMCAVVNKGNLVSALKMHVCMYVCIAVKDQDAGHDVAFRLWLQQPDSVLHPLK